MPIQTTDEVLLEAMRQRMKRQLDKEEERTLNNVINNYSGGGSSSGGGVMAQMGGAKDDPEIDPYDYIVDIQKSDVIDPATGKSTGWNKKVHRYRSEKGSEPKKKRG